MSFDTSQRPYRELRSLIAEKTNKLVIWIGSGLSAAAGLPTWPELKSHLIDDLREKAGRIAPADAARPPPLRRSPHCGPLQWRTTCLCIRGIRKTWRAWSVSSSFGRCSGSLRGGLCLVGAKACRRSAIRGVTLSSEGEPQNVQAGARGGGEAQAREGELAPALVLPAEGSGERAEGGCRPAATNSAARAHPLIGHSATEGATANRAQRRNGMRRGADGDQHDSAPPQASGSVASMPKSTPAVARAAANAATAPSAAPGPPRMVPWRTTSPRTSRCVARSAMRIPISCVRCTIA